MRMPPQSLKGVQQLVLRPPYNELWGGSGRFHKLGFLFVDVLFTNALLFGIYIGAPDLGKRPYGRMRGHLPSKSIQWWRLGMAKLLMKASYLEVHGT